MFKRIKTKSFNFYLIKLEDDATDITFVSDNDTTSVVFMSKKIGRSCVRQVVGRWKYEGLISKLIYPKVTTLELDEYFLQIKGYQGVWALLIEAV